MMEKDDWLIYVCILAMVIVASWIFFPLNILFVLVVARVGFEYGQLDEARKEWRKRDAV